jgi:hypothetical protein
MNKSRLNVKQSHPRALRNDCFKMLTFYETIDKSMKLTGASWENPSAVVKSHQSWFVFAMYLVKNLSAETYYPF